jgi:hypothetical protein
LVTTRVSVFCSLLFATAAGAQCPPGQLVGDDTQGHCCWPNQVWSSASNTCRGIPICPAGFTTDKESCARHCPDGQAVSADTQGQCCWPGQAWSAHRGVCVGIPSSCPDGKPPTGEWCGDSPPPRPVSGPAQPTPPPPVARKPKPSGPSCVASELPEWKDANAKEKKALLDRCRQPRAEEPSADWPTPPPFDNAAPATAHGGKCVASQLPEWKDANAREKKELLKRCAAPVEELPPAP